VLTRSLRACSVCWQQPRRMWPVEATAYVGCLVRSTIADVARRGVEVVMRTAALALLGTVFVYARLQRQSQRSQFNWSHLMTLAPQSIHG